MEVLFVVIQILLCLLLIFTMGLLMILMPERLWKLKHWLSVKGGEPTEFYLVMMRIGGVGLIFLSVILAIFTAGEIF